MRKEERGKIIERLERGGEYSVIAGRKYFYVCKNNGQAHKGNAPSGSGGWATFIGKYTADEIKECFKHLL